MKILVFAHTSQSGGAEKALRHLVDILRVRHKIHVALPTLEGPEPEHYRSIDILGLESDAPYILPHTSSALLHYARQGLDSLARPFLGAGYDLIISNTISKVHGGLVAARLGIPHIFYAHEFLEDPEFLPTAISKGTFLKLIEEMSAAVISCSAFVASQFSAPKRALLPVLEPFDYSQPASSRGVREAAEMVLQVIGTQSHRKNTQFAVALTKALRLRGLDVRLDIIGTKHTGSWKLERAIAKRGVGCRVLPFHEDPYGVNAHTRVITLVCSLSEPYGLTLPESLRRGIPVLASRSGGPAEFLPDSMLFEIDNLDDCARKVMLCFESYASFASEALSHYQTLQKRITKDQLSKQLDRLLERVALDFRPSREPSMAQLITRLRGLVDLPLDVATLAENIAKVQSEEGQPTSAEEILDAIEAEKDTPGASVLADIHRFDAVPFAMSDEMQALYKRGVGLAIELTATLDDEARLQMSAFIACALSEVQESLGRPPRVLCFGDGIGIDSIRLARMGASVHYIDFDGSRMSRIARLNVASAKEWSDFPLAAEVVDSAREKYDAIVCLEVIEHVPQPEQFSAALSNFLEPDGILFISECFDGIEDRWPTHLYENEAYAGMLPLVLQRHFRLVGGNHQPFGKPYVYQKLRNPPPSDTPLLLFDRFAMMQIVTSRLELGI